MSPSITEVFNGISDAGFPSRTSSEIVRLSQHESFFYLAAAKKSRAARVEAHFKGREVKRVLISGNLGSSNFELPGCEVVNLEKGYFQEQDPQRRAEHLAFAEDAIVIVNNNDVGLNNGTALYGDFFQRSEKTIFIAWDWDNHHWLDNSTYFAAHCDLYAPAHQENLYLLTRYNWTTIGPVYCSTGQWPRRYLTEQLPVIATAERTDDPLGKHIAYSPFMFRNRVVSTLGQRYSSIGFSDRTFHVKTIDDRLKEWYSHKTHWIVPVLNDVSLRIFDALVTGGIPIVPESIRYLAPVNGIGKDHIVFYGPDDIIDPTRVVNRAIELFDRGGLDKLVERHRFALDFHHADNRMRQMLACAVDKFGMTPLAAGAALEA